MKPYPKPEPKPPKTITLQDENNLPIEITYVPNDWYQNEFTVKWNRTIETISYSGSDPADDEIKYVRNFTIDLVNGIELTIKNNTFYILQNEPIEGTISRPDESDVTIHIYGTANRRTLEAGFPKYMEWFHGTVPHDTTVDDIKFVGFEFDGRGDATGMKLKIHDHDYTLSEGCASKSPDTKKTLEAILVQEIVDTTGLDKIPSLFKQLECLRLLNILEGKDTLQLLKTIDTLQQKVSKLEKNLTVTRTKLSDQAQTIDNLTQELTTVKSARDTLQGERDQFTGRVKDALLATLGSFH